MLKFRWETEFKETEPKRQQIGFLREKEEK